MTYEPMVIDAKTVAEYLEHMHLPRMAQWVLGTENAIARERLTAEVFRRELSDTLRRLEKYEPSIQQHTPVSCVPPPESSD
jgi:hypothetical protein